MEGRIVENTRAVEIKEISRKSFTVAGYGMVWGGEDLFGESFTPETKLWLEEIGETPMVLYEHGEDDGIKRTVIGRVVKTVKDEIGLWVEAQIDRAGKYAGAIRELIEQGLLGWSSGAVNYLVERSEQSILSWPIVEFSLTPIPAEPRTLGVQEVRSIYPSWKRDYVAGPARIELAVEGKKKVLRVHLTEEDLWPQ